MNDEHFELTIGLSFVYRCIAAGFVWTFLFWGEPDIHGALVAILMGLA